MKERTSFLILLVVLSATMIWLFRPFLTPIFVALTFVITLWPLYRPLKKGLWQKGWLASLLVTVLLTLVLIFPVAFLVGLVTEQAIQMARDLPPLLKNGLPMIRSLGDRFGVVIPLDAILPDLLQKGAMLASQFSPTIFTHTTHLVFQFILTLFLTFFLFIEGPALYQELLHLSPIKRSYEEHLAYEIQNTLSACLYGYVLTALAQGILAGLCFMIAGIPLAAILGLLTVVASFIPIIGAAGVWVPVAISLFISGQWGWGLFVSLYGGLIISGIDNVLKPLIIQGKTRIHPLLVFLAIFGGLKAFGPVGILVGPILTSIFLASLKIYKADFLNA